MCRAVSRARPQIQPATIQCVKAFPLAPTFLRIAARNELDGRPEVLPGSAAHSPGSEVWKARNVALRGTSKKDETGGVLVYNGALRSVCSGGPLKMDNVTQILCAIQQGDPRAADRLLPLVYAELRRLAAQRLAQEQPGQTLQATALVHEVYLRLVDVELIQKWDGRGHFFAAAAEAMRRILIERARKQRTLKRGGRETGSISRSFRWPSMARPSS